MKFPTITQVKGFSKIKPREGCYFESKGCLACGAILFVEVSLLVRRRGGFYKILQRRFAEHKCDED